MLHQAGFACIYIPSPELCTPPRALKSQQKNLPTLSLQPFFIYIKIFQ